MDNTQHLVDMHPAVDIPKHTKDWYAVWGDKCPQCGVEAEITDEA